MSDIEQALSIAVGITATIVCLQIIITLVTTIISKVVFKVFKHNIAMFILNRLTFIGTVHHELSHALFALMTGAKITKIELFKPVGNTLGQVSYIPRGNKFIVSVQNVMVAIAPVITGLFSSCMLIFVVYHKYTAIWQRILVIYLLISIVLHMNMSKEDIKNGIKSLPIFILIIFIVVMTVHKIGV